LLLAERDMTVAELYQMVKWQGFNISSSHFFRQMTPYPNAVRPDLLVEICKALGCQPAELFDLVEVSEESNPREKPKVVTPKLDKPKKTTEATVAQEIDDAKRRSAEKRKIALLAPRVTVLGLKEQ
jgi:DNA-binding Xre family transcriptional regulator